MADAPLTLRLAARKPRTMVGEGIVLDVAHEVREKLEMETVALNRGRTEILVRSLEQGEYGNRVLTGEDYMVLYRHPPLVPVGTRFVAPAGSKWTVQLELCRYTRPLPAGKYSIELAYRWGGGEADVVHTDPVTVEVAPSGLGDVEYRWLGGANARERLSSLWTAQTADGARVVYQVALPHDPGVVETASAIELPGAAPLGPARLAHLNDIAAMHWERFAYWAEQGGLGWLKVHPYGRSGDPGVAPLDSAGAAHPVEPALQSRANVLQALFLRPGPAVLWLELDRTGKSSQRTFPLPGATTPLAACVCWNRGEEPVAGTLFWVEPGELGTIRLVAAALPGGERRVLHEAAAELVGLEIDQWMGFASVHLLAHVREQDPRTHQPVERLEIAQWSFDEGAVAAGPRWALPLGPDALAIRDLRQTVPLPGGAGVALLFERPDGFIAWTPEERARVAPPADATVSHPHLVASRDRLFFVFHEPQRGFSALPVFERRE